MENAIKLLKTKHATFLFLSLIWTVSGWAQVSISSFPWSQATSDPFTNSATLPAGFVSTNNSASAGSADILGTSAPGTTATGSSYVWYYSTTPSKSCVGYVFSSGFKPAAPTITFTFKNTTGATITSLAMSVDYSKLRQGTRTESFTLTGPGGSTVPTSLNYTYAADGAVATMTFPGTSVTNTGTITGLSIANNATATFTWTISGANTSSHAIGLGNIVLSVPCTNPTLTGASQAATVCNGSAATINLTGLVASSTSNAIDYTINGVAQTQITGIAANASGNASFTTPALTSANNGQTLQVTKITNGSCSTTFTQNVTLAVNTTPTVTTQPTAQSVTAPSSAAFSVVAAGTVGGYQWQVSTDGGGTWTNVSASSPYSGTTSASLTINPTSTALTGYQYRCVVSGSSPCANVTSNAATLTVAAGGCIIPADPTGTINLTNNCGTTTLSHTVSTYYWQGTNSTGTDLSKPTSSSYVASANGTYYVRAYNASSGGCWSAGLQSIAVMVNNAPTTTAGTALSTCSSNGAVNITAGSSATNQTGVLWTSSGTGTFTNATSLTACTYTPGSADITAGSVTLTLTATGSSPCANAVSTKTLTITTSPTPAVSVAAVPTGAICAGTSVTFTATTSNTGGGTVSYQWYNGATAVGTNSNTYTSTTLANGNQISCAITITGGSCISSTTATSSAITMTVNAVPANPTGTINPAANPACTSTTVSYSAASASIYWESSATGTSTANPTSTNYTISTIGSTILYVRSYNGNCWSSGTLNSGAILVQSAPSISVQPTAVSAAAGNSTTFSVTASNAVSYQWYVNSGSGFTAISNTGVYSGATSATLTISDVTGLGGNTYEVVVIGTSPCASVTSSSATLTLTSTLWSNPITQSTPDPSTTNPFTSGDVTDPNITVSGIGRGTGITATTGANRYNANTWNTASLSANSYFSFTLTPDAGYAINFANFSYNGQASGTGPTNFEVKSSLDGYTSAIGSAAVTSTTIDLSAAAYQNISSAITFRIYAWGASASAGTFSINDFSFTGDIVSLCTTADSIAFLSSPTSVTQDLAMSTVTVKAICKSSGGTASSYTGPITLTASGNGCGYTSQTVNAVAGIATFSNIIFSRSTQTGISLTASAPGLNSVVSNTFNVTAPTGTPVQTTIINENFDGSTPTWSYASTTVTNNTSLGSPFVGLKDYTTNPYGNSTYKKSLVKSQTDNNNASQGESTSRITFSNVTGLSSYNSVKVSFLLGSLPSQVTGASGNGVDANENFIVETSLDGGSTWSTCLTYFGFSNFLLPFSTTSPATLAYNANASYNADGSNSTTQSAFVINLPSGTSQFRMRLTATDNREEENWAIDNIQIIGTTQPLGTPRALPTATGNTYNNCPNLATGVGVALTNTQGTTTYSWSPATNISSTTSAGPSVYPSASTSYTVTVTDADGCTASATDVISITTQPGAVALAPGSMTAVEPSCADASGWTYYTDPSDATKWVFAIYKNGNTFTANIDLTVKTGAPVQYDSTVSNPIHKGLFTMGRYWNATLATGSINGASNPVKVRFFFSPADTAALRAAASARATAWGLSGNSMNGLEWFKTTSGFIYAPGNNTYSDVPNKLNPSSFSVTGGSINGVSYIEYDGLQGFSGGTGAIRVSPAGLALPVELMSFVAAPIDNDYVRLDWATASETDDYGFDIERSTDGVNFDKIGFVAGHGTTSVQNNYVFNDKNVLPNAIYYYRLKQLDVDGKYEYSAITSAMLVGREGFVLEGLRPNPAIETVVINVVSTSDQNATVTFTDMLGREVLSQPWQISPGLNGTSIALSDIAAGTYQVSVRSANASFSRKLVVTR